MTKRLKLLFFYPTFSYRDLCAIHIEQLSDQQKKSLSGGMERIHLSLMCLFLTVVIVLKIKESEIVKAAFFLNYATKIISTVKKC